MASSGMLRRVALVRTDVSEELSASFIRVHRFLQEPHGVTSQKTPFSIVTAVKTSNLTKNKTLSRIETATSWLISIVAHSRMSERVPGFL
jgi:hypothetical protein